MDDLGFARDDAEAAARARLYRDTDPFAGIAASLLHMEHVRQYVAKTGMIWPFDDSPDHRKRAAYEVKVKGKCIYWDEHGTKIPLDLAYGVEFRLKPNSIAFVTLEPRFRLPNYIAVRFNLKVTHVYRGLLAGTGPLVDPGYDNFLFVPIHNLTTNDYIIRGGDPLVWMNLRKWHLFRPKCLAPLKASHYLQQPRRSQQTSSSIFVKLTPIDQFEARFQRQLETQFGSLVRLWRELLD